MDTAAAARPFDDPAPVADVAGAARCESCGGPADDGDLCAGCQHAFHSVLDSTKGSTKIDNTMQAVDNLFAAFEVAQIEANASPVLTPPIAEPEVPQAPSVAEIALTPSAPPTPEIAPAPAAKTEPTRPLSIDRTPARPREPMFVSVSSTHGGRSRSLAAAVAVVVVVGVIGLPLSRLLMGREKPPVARAEQVAQGRSESPSASPRSKKTRARDRTTASAPLKPSTSVPAPRAVSARVQPKAARPSDPSSPQAGSIAMPNPATEAPAEAVPPAPETVAPEPPAPAPAAAPVGQFFELRQVDQSPQVASRVEPQVPESLQRNPLNEIVVVRVLVSQSGHPSLVSLLRRSKAGRALDDAVVAAVKQWTFTPALKRGETVSCWFHVGVPIGRTE